jgi:hypothetical protein
VLAGDSQLVPLYWAIVRKLDHDAEPRPAAGGSLTTSTHSVDIDFIWDPFLNSTDLHRNVDAQSASDGPALIVLATGRDNDMHMTAENFAAAVDGVTSSLGSSTTAGVSDGNRDLLLFAPVRESYHGAEDQSGAAHMAMNAHLADHEDEARLQVLWTFAEMTQGRRDKSHGDGWALQWELSDQMADILLNLRCNAAAAKSRSFPNIRTCCGTWAGPNWIQASFLILALFVLPVCTMVDYLWPSLNTESRKCLRYASAFALAISIQFAADRTHIYEQTIRLPLRMANLQGMLVATLLIGLVTIRRCSPVKGFNQSSLPFLPREQTDEMKGWMQVLIVVYHYNMAWTADRFWEIIRLAVAGYLLLTGFGHSIYFLQKRDYSLRRVAAVLIRTNLLPCTLAFVMRTRWLLYYYM